MMPERGAAQGVGIAGPGRPLADGEEADQQVQLVGQSDGDRDVRAWEPRRSGPCGA